MVGETWFTKAIITIRRWRIAAGSWVIPQPDAAFLPWNFAYLIWGFSLTQGIERTTHGNVNKNCIKYSLHFELLWYIILQPCPALLLCSLRFSPEFSFCLAFAVAKRWKKLVTAKCVYNFFETTFTLRLRRQVLRSLCFCTFRPKSRRKRWDGYHIAQH